MTCIYIYTRAALVLWQPRLPIPWSKVAKGIDKITRILHSLSWVHAPGSGYAPASYERLRHIAMKQSTHGSRSCKK